MISPSKKKSKNKDKHRHHDKDKDKDKDKEKDSKYKTNLYQNETNYSIKLLIVEGKIQIFIKASKSFSEDIYEFSNTYSFRQLQITNKYFSNFNDVDEVCADLDKLLKLKVIVEEEKDKTLILKIPTSTDKSSGDIIFKLMRLKKVKKVRHSSRDKIRNNNIDIINKKLYETNIPRNETTNLLLGNINELVDRVKKLEKKEIEKDKTINKLKEKMNNYQEKLNSSYNYPIYSPLAKNPDIKINLADDRNNNISQIIKQRNEEIDDDDIDINFETDTIKEKKKKKKKKTETINTDIKNKSDDDNDDEVDSDESVKKKKKKKKKKNSDSFLDESKKNISNGKEDSDEDKSNNILLKSANRNFNINNYKPQPQDETTISGFQIIPRDKTLKEYINSRIFYTIREMQTIKRQITQGKRSLHAYFDLLYRASIDGPEENKIDSFCKGKYPQLILFFTQEGARFGVYVAKEKVKSIFKKEEYFKEIPGTSFLFSLNTLKIFPIQPKETATDNRAEKLCFGRTYYYNSNESNWLIYIPNNDFLNCDLKFGDKESDFHGASYSDIVGNSYNYHLKDVEIFQVLFEDDGDGDENNNKEEKKTKKKKSEKVEKTEKIEEENDEDEKIDVNNIHNDDTVISQKKENEENGQEEEEIKIVEKSKKKDKKKDKVKIELSKVDVNDEEDNL